VTNDSYEELMFYCEKWIHIYNDLLSFSTMKEFHETLEDEYRSVSFFDL
jgi:hypothetical protein